MASEPSNSTVISRKRHARLLDDHLVNIVKPASWQAEPYRMLRHALQEQPHNGGGRILAVTSPAPGDGKTTTCINLAAALAESATERTLLIDADLRCGAISKYLGLGEAVSPGLFDALESETLQLSDVLWPQPQWQFSLVAAGPRLTAPYHLMHSSRLGALFGQARGLYDLVVVDTPPLVSVTDCRALAQWVDGFLLVVAAHKTPRRLVQEALNVLPSDKTLGLVFNGDDGAVWGSNRYYPRDARPVVDKPIYIPKGN